MPRSSSTHQFRDRVSARFSASFSTTAISHLLG
jgi:hypothetical protein